MSELTQEQKLSMLGLRNPVSRENAAEEAIHEFKTNVGNWSTFETEVGNQTSWADFETMLDNSGVETSKAGEIRTQFENKYSSWSDFESTVTNTHESYDDLRNDFQSGSNMRSEGETDAGRAMAGYKIYEEAGVGRDGQPIPRGAVEIYGTEVHLSQTQNLRDTREDDSGASDPIAYSNLTVSNTTPEIGENFDVSADITNNVSYAQSIVAQFKVDDEVKRTTSTNIAANSTITVTFSWAFNQLGSFEVTIGPLPPETIGVVPRGTYS